MKCERCQAEDSRSRATEIGRISTAMWCPPFYDEDGKHHHHDANITTVSYQCTNGHLWQVDLRGSRCWCGWPDDAERRTSGPESLHKRPAGGEDA